MALFVGVNVQEVDGSAPPTIQAAPTSVAAFLGRTIRGLPNRPVYVTTPKQFQDRFGGYLADGYLAYSIDGFFLNGGQEAYVSRVVGAGSVPAAITLDNRASATPAPALLVTAGYRGQPDPGTWGQNVRLDVRDDPNAVTTLAADAKVGDTSAQLTSLAGIQVGSLVRFVTGTTVEARKITTITPGKGTVAWDSGAPLTQAHAASATRVATSEFRLIISYQQTPGADFTVVETWPNLSTESDSPQYFLTLVNHPITGSQYVLVTDLTGSTSTDVKGPAVVSNKALAGGANGTPGTADYVGTAALKTGLYAFDTVQVQLLVVPDAHTLASGRRDVVQAALDYCALRNDCTFVGAAPDRASSTNPPRAVRDYTQLESDYLRTIADYSAPFQGAKVYGALYAPWIRVLDPAGTGPAPTRFVPPDGHVLGVYASTQLAQGIWKAPAGIDAQVLGALDLSATFTDPQHTDMVQNSLVNGIRRTSGTGITVAASRTLSTDTRWWFVSTRLLFNFVKSSLRDGLRFVRQQPNTDSQRRTVKFNVVTPFLLGLWRQGAFGTDPPAQVFTVKCDAQNNPPSEVDLGNFRVEIYFYPVRPVETVLIVVGQQPSGSSTSEG